MPKALRARPGRRAFDAKPIDGLDAPDALDHLRRIARALPASPGVYVFEAQEGDLPLYIGKSVNLRSRVLSHLRNPDEARMLRQTRRISHVRTAGEIGALLLEASMIKQRHPLMNQRLRRTRQLCSIRLVDGVPEVVASKDFDFAVEPGLHGLFSSRHAALDALRELADPHRLCHALLGLERPAHGRGCFRSMLGRCAGACRGGESAEAHGVRLAEALASMAVACWPYPGAIGLVERDDRIARIHVIRNWCYLGTVDTPEQARGLGSVAAGFDADGYRILCGPIIRGEAEILPL